MEKRRASRYLLRLPCSVTRLGAEKVTLPGITIDVSSRGALFSCGAEIDPGTYIEYVLTLRQDGPPLKLRCLGKVLRVDPLSTARGSYRIAATVERHHFLKPESESGAPHSEVAAETAPGMSHGTARS